MKCDTEVLIAYHYDDIDRGEKEQFETHLRNCQDCQKELAQMRQSSHMLSAWTDEDPQLKLHFVGAKSPRTFTWPIWLQGARGMGLGLALVACVFLLALSEFEVNYRDGSLDLHLAFGSSTQKETALLTKADLYQIQEQTLSQVAHLLQGNEARQQQQLGIALSHFANELNTWRQQDLQIVDHRLRQYDWQTRNRFRRNEEALNQLMPAQYHIDQ